MLADALKIPSVIITNNRLRATGVDALCMLLRRLSYPNRLVEHIRLFGRSDDEISRFCSHVAAHLYSNFKGLFSNLNARRLIPRKLKELSQAISAQGAPLQNVWGFVDGTVRPICRPGIHQRQVYNGHKRVHALKFQSVSTADGIIVHLTGPWEGRRHDAYIFQQSKLEEQLRAHSFGPDGEPMHIYGDPAYPLSVHLMCPFKGMAQFQYTL